ncbi:MAG: hypothetical protein M0015_18865 [Betaproteobacteria bacterium]|nr:hypothetical protein [Betaproteobacteria bacterium]
MATLARWFESGETAGRLVTLESEHSMLTAAAAAAATGVRVLSATSSQGLLYAMEMLYTVAGWRAPVEDYLKLKGRFRHLFEPQRDAAALAAIQAQVDGYWQAV